MTLVPYPDLLPAPITRAERKRRNALPVAEQLRIHATEEFARRVAYGELPASPMRLARLRAGLTQRELGRHAYLSESMISMIERGVRKPPMRSAIHIANALGVPLSYLWPELKRAER